jgi:hypothetical protein
MIFVDYMSTWIQLSKPDPPTRVIADVSLEHNVKIILQGHGNEKCPQLFWPVRYVYAADAVGSGLRMSLPASIFMLS